jgi:hypothetical protein
MVMGNEEELIEDCLNRDSKLSAWEADFLESIQAQLSDKKKLSEKQIVRLEEIWERVTENG